MELLSKDLKKVPDEIQDILERCLAGVASPENLALYLPGMQKIFTYVVEIFHKKHEAYMLSKAYEKPLQHTPRGETPQPHDPGLLEVDSRASIFLALSTVNSVKARRSGSIRRGISASHLEERINSGVVRETGVSAPWMSQTKDIQMSSTASSSSQIRVPISRSESATPLQGTTKQRPETPQGPSRVAEWSLAEVKQEISLNASRMDKTLWETMQDDASPPELSHRIQKLNKRPRFEGTYSRVYYGEYKGKKVSRSYFTSLNAKNTSQVAIKEIRSVKSKRVTNRVCILAKYRFNINKKSIEISERASSLVETTSSKHSTPSWLH
jgi:hypothetical protein